MHGLVGELGVGTVTHSTLQMGLGISALMGGLGLVFMLSGGGVIWAARAKRREGTEVPEVTIPDTVPEEMVEEAAATT